VLAAISSQALFATNQNAPPALEETLVDLCGVLTAVKEVRTIGLGLQSRRKMFAGRVFDL
jgi:hypothetical protein